MNSNNNSIDIRSLSQPKLNDKRYSMQINNTFNNTETKNSKVSHKGSVILSSNNIFSKTITEKEKSNVNNNVNNANNKNKFEKSLTLNTSTKVNNKKGSLVLTSDTKSKLDQINKNKNEENNVKKNFNKRLTTFADGKQINKNMDKRVRFYLFRKVEHSLRIQENQQLFLLLILLIKVEKDQFNLMKKLPIKVEINQTKMKKKQMIQKVKDNLFRMKKIMLII